MTVRSQQELPKTMLQAFNSVMNDNWDHSLGGWGSLPALPRTTLQLIDLVLNNGWYPRLWLHPNNSKISVTWTHIQNLQYPVFNFIIKTMCLANL